jgi:serine/threonine protein kinase
MILASGSLAQMTSGMKGTVNYLAPELLDVTDLHVKHSKQTDVWAFSMTLYVRIRAHASIYNESYLHQ